MKKYGIYNHGKLQSIMDTDCEEDVIKTVQDLRDCSSEPVPSIDYLPFTQKGRQEFKKREVKP